MLSVAVREWSKVISNPYSFNFIVFAVVTLPFLIIKEHCKLQEGKLEELGINNPYFELLRNPCLLFSFPLRILISPLGPFLYSRVSAHDFRIGFHELSATNLALQ